MERKYIVWDEEKSNRLYDYAAEKPSAESSFFGYQVGEGIIKLLDYFVTDMKNVKVLDYGCGMGHIIGHMLERGIYVEGVDMSPDCVELVNKKFASYPNWGGAATFGGERLPYESDLFDVITVTEVIEHILPKHMELFLSELLRVLKQRGAILFTTPNDEDFSKNEILCPECNTVFHKHGHCNKFTIQSIKELMESHGYKTILCDATDFYRFQKKEERHSLLDFNLRRLITMWRNLRNRNMDITDDGTYTGEWFRAQLGGDYCPNLFYVGTK